MKAILSPSEVLRLAKDLVQTMPRAVPFQILKVFPIPRGGVPALFSIMSKSFDIIEAATPDEADFFIDDIIDSGSTMQLWCDRYPGKPFYALIDKTDANCKYRNHWVVFPWETQGGEGASLDDSIVGTITNRIKRNSTKFHANDNISEFIESPLELDQLQNEIEVRAEHLLRGLIIDIDDDHNTKNTARRLSKMYLNEIFKGRYHEPPTITDFPNAKGLDELYTTGPITVRSHCSHHFLPVTGECWIGVVPAERVIGLSKFNRIVDWIASRPQLQEEMTIQIADYLQEQIKPKGLAVVIKASHGCMTCRGVHEPTDSAMSTSVMRGVFREKPEARAEFFSLIGIK